MPSDYLLELDGIKGESKIEKHRSDIDIMSYSWGVSQGTSFTQAGGHAGGKVSFQDLHFTKRIDKSSPLLARACAAGQHIKKAVLFVRKAGDDGRDYLRFEFADCLVSSYQSQAQNGGLPMEQVSMNYSKVEFDYLRFNTEGVELIVPFDEPSPPGTP